MREEKECELTSSSAFRCQNYETGVESLQRSLERSRLNSRFHVGRNDSGGPFRSTVSSSTSFMQLAVHPFGDVGFCGMFVQPFFDRQLDGAAEIALLSSENCDNGQSESAFGFVRKNYEHFSQSLHSLTDAILNVIIINI